MMNVVIALFVLASAQQPALAPEFLDDSLKDVFLDVGYHIQPNILKEGKDLEAVCSGDLAMNDILLFILDSNATEDFFDMPLYIFEGAGGAFFLEEEHDGILIHAIQQLDAISDTPGLIVGTFYVTIHVTTHLEGYTMKCKAELASGNGIIQRESTVFEVLEMPPTTEPKPAPRVKKEDPNIMSKLYGLLSSHPSILLFAGAAVLLIIQKKKIEQVCWNSTRHLRKDSTMPTSRRRSSGRSSDAPTLGPLFGELDEHDRWRQMEEGCPNIDNSESDSGSSRSGGTSDEDLAKPHH